MTMASRAARAVVRQRKGWLWVGVCLALASCDDSDTGAVRVLSAQTPLALEQGLLYVTTEPNQDHSALLLDVSRGRAQLSVHALPEGEVTMQPRPAHEGEVLLLSQGRPAELVDGEGRDAIDSFLLRYDRKGERQRYQLSGRYGALAVSEDGRFVVAFAPSGTWSTADSIAVIDLRPEGSRHHRARAQWRGPQPSRIFTGGGAT
jgi:hypothetical protein